MNTPTPEATQPFNGYKAVVDLIRDELKKAGLITEYGDAIFAVTRLIKERAEVEAKTIAAVRRLIDYEASGQKMWYNECIKEGHEGCATQKGYQCAHNALVILREKITPTYLAGAERWDGPEATERIFEGRT